MITFAPAWLLVHTKPRCRRSCRAIKWLLTLIFLVARGYAAHLAARNKVGTQFVAEEGSPQFVVWDEYLKMLGRHALATDCRAVDPLRIDPYEILVTADDDIGLVTAVAHELQDPAPADRQDRYRDDSSVGCFAVPSHFATPASNVSTDIVAGGAPRAIVAPWTGGP